MINEEYAYEYTYNLPYKYQDEFKQAEKEVILNSFANQCKDGEEAEINEQIYNDAKNAFSNFTEKIIDEVTKL